MKQTTILLGFFLAVGILAGGTRPAAAAEPLDGKVFRSVEKLVGGERRDGTINRVHWTIRFKGKSFEWQHTDVISRGTYEYDTKTGAIVLKDSGLKAQYDARTGVLTWDKRKYEEVKEGKK